MIKYDDTVYLPSDFTDVEYQRKFNKAVKKYLEDIHNVGNVNLVQPAAFSVHKNGADQTGVVTSTFTKVTWPTEIYDINSEFAGDKFTPSARVVTICAGVRINGLGDGKSALISLYKNGADYKRGNLNTNGGASAIICVGSWQDKANGTDYYEIYAWHNHGANRDIEGDATDTYFMGY